MLFSTDKLGVVRKIRFAVLEKKRLQLLAAHDSRAPKDDELFGFVTAYRDLLEVTSPPATRVKFGLFELYEALGDPIAALAVAAEIAETASASNIRRAASYASRVVTRLGKKEHTRRYKGDKAAKTEVLLLCDRIVAKAPDGFEKERLRLFLQISRKQFQRAVETAGALGRMKKSGVTDFIRLVDQLVERTDLDRLLPTIARELTATRPAIEAAGKRNFLLGLRTRFRDDPDVLAALDLAPLDAGSVTAELAGMDRRAIETFVSRREILIGGGDSAEAIKMAGLAEYRRRLGGVTIGAAQPEQKYLVLMSNALKFWDDAGFRTEVLADIERLIGRRRDENASMTLGSVHLLRGDLGKAEKLFEDVARRSKVIAKSGASSFVADMERYNVSDALATVDVDFGSTTKAESAFVACADVRYFRRYGPSYLASLRETGSRTRAHLHVAGAPDDAWAAIREIGAGADNVSFSVESPPLALPAYYASMRFLRAPVLLDHVAGRVVLTDIDVQFRANPDGFAGNPAFADADIGLRMYDKIRVVREASRTHRTVCRYPRTYGWNQINAACVVLIGSERGRRAAAMASRDMAQHLQRVVDRGINAWWVDQNALFYTYRRLAADGVTRFANIEDLGMPYGSFDYSDAYVLGGQSPLFTHEG